jgi:hypothetical protein
VAFVVAGDTLCLGAGQAREKRMDFLVFLDLLWGDEALSRLLLRELIEQK